MAPPSKAYLQAAGAADDVARLEAKTLQALVPVMAAAQKELAHDLAGWYAKLGPNAAEQKFTVAHARQMQILLGIAEAKAQTTAAGYPHASFPKVAATAVQNAMGQNMPNKLAVQTLEGQLQTLRAKFADLPSPQLLHAAMIAKGDQLVLNKFKASANRYGGQVGQDMRFQFGIGLVKGETIQQLTKRLAGLGSFQKMVDANHPQAAGAAVAGGLTKRYENWAQRLVRTEMSGAYNSAALAGIRAAHKLDDRIKAVWDATNDMRVCPVCYALHGKQVTPGNNFPGAGMHPPAHPNCRCAIVSWVEDYEDEEVPYVPSVEEVEAKEKAIQQQDDNAKARAAASAEQQAAAKEDLAAYEQHKIAEAAKKAAAEKAAAEAKAKAEAEAYAKQLAAEKAAAEAAAKQAAEEAAKKQAAKEKAAAKKAAKAAEEAKKAQAITGAPFNPATSGNIGYIPAGKKHGLNKIMQKEGMVLKDKDTIVGHGYEIKWTPADGKWVTQKGPTDLGYKYDYYDKKQWVPSGLAPASWASTPAAKAAVVQAAAPAPVPLGAQPMEIKGHEWKAVNNQWVLHKDGTPTSQLVPKQTASSPMLNDSYSLGQDLAAKGLVPTGLGVMEGHGYKFVKTGAIWEKVEAQGKPYTKPAPAPSSTARAATPPPAPAWKPTPIKLAANRKGVTNFDKHPSHEYAGFHGRAFTQDGDVVEGGSVRVIKVKDSNGQEYYEAMFKVTHPYGSAAQSYGSGSANNWTFRQRNVKNGVMVDTGAQQSQSVKTRIHTGEDGHTVEVGTTGAVTNQVRIRAKSLKELNSAMDGFSEHLGADLRKPPEKEDLQLQAKARLAAKFDPETFGRRMQNAQSPEQQKAVIEDVWKAQAAKHPVMAKALEDAKEVEVYPGHKTLYSESLGKHMAAHWGAMYHDGSPPAEIAASIVGDTGLMSSVKRFNSGVFTTGMSTSTDFGTGGADGVFMRVSREVPKTAGGKFRAVLDTEKVMGRLDWWAFNYDNYGRSGYSEYDSRWSIASQKATSHPPGGNEVMATNGVPPSAFKKFICPDPKYRDQVLKELRKQGIKEINGKKIEDFVTLS